MWCVALVFPLLPLVKICVCSLYWYLFVWQRQHWLYASENNSEQDVSLSFEHLGRPIKLKASQVNFIRSAGNYVELNTHNNVYLKRASLKEMESKLPDYFFLSHRSYLVNLHQVQSMQNLPSGNGKLQLKNGAFVEVSKRNKAMLKRTMSNLATAVQN